MTTGPELTTGINSLSTRTDAMDGLGTSYVDPASWPSPTWPTAATTGYEQASGYPGSLTNYTGSASITSATTFNFVNFNGTGLNVSHPSGTVTFNGCRITNTDKDGSCIIHSGSGAIVLNDCEIGPDQSRSKSTVWPSPGINSGEFYGDSNPGSLMVPYSLTYQYGFNKTGSGTATLNRCHIWGGGNLVDLKDGNITLNDCLLNDMGAYHDINHWHHDGVAYTDGGTSGVLSNVTINHCTIASLGNTNGIGMQKGKYNNWVIHDSYFAGFGVLLDLSTAGNGLQNTNCRFYNNTISNCIVPVYSFCRSDNSSYFGTGRTDNQWENNKVEIVRSDDTHGYVLADNGKYLYPNGSVSSTDFVDGY